jgi:hypothetical protein
VIGTLPPNATYSTASSAACTTAYTPDSTYNEDIAFPITPTTRPLLRRLDKLSAWDVSSAGVADRPEAACR